MNPNDNNLNINQNTNQNTQPLNNFGSSNPTPPTPPEPISSIAPKDEIPMSVEKVEKSEEPAPVTNIFSQDLNIVNTQVVNNQSSTIGEVKPDQDLKPALEEIKLPEVTQNPIAQTTDNNLNSNQNVLYNFQTNAINPNASVNLNDFRIDEDDKKPPLPEISNLETTVETKPINPEPIKETVTILNSVPNTTEPITSEPKVVTPPSANNSIIIAVLGVIFALGLISGAYFVFFRKPTTTETPTASSSEFKTEKIIVKANSEAKTLTEEEYVTTVKSYIERYNANIRNFKVKQATPNLTIEQKLELYMNYSTEVLNIYTELQNLKVPQSYRDSHDNLTLSLYALNSLFDTLVIEAKNKTLTVANEKQILEKILKAETAAAASFNAIANSK